MQRIAVVRRGACLFTIQRPVLHFRAFSSETEFKHPKAKEMFDKITSTLSKHGVLMLGDVVNAIFGRPLRKNEFFVHTFGAKRRGGKASAEAEGSTPEVEEKKSTFDLKLSGYEDSAKIKVIKEIRSILGLGLKEAKELVESAPKVIQKDVKPEKAEELKKKLEEVGAKIELV